MPRLDLTTAGHEDWIKARTWDLLDVQSLDDLLRHMKVAEGTSEEMTAALKKFQMLPAWRAAPPLLKSQAAAWLQAVGAHDGPGS